MLSVLLNKNVHPSLPHKAFTRMYPGSVQTKVDLVLTTELYDRPYVVF